jgi:hypothetical protein
MKTLTKTSVKTVAILTLGVMIAGSASAKGDGDGNQRGNKQGDEVAGKGMPGKEEHKAFRKAQSVKIKAFHKAGQEKRKANMEASKNEEDPYKIVATVKANHEKSQAEAATFFGGIQAEGAAFMESMFAKYDVPAEKQAEILERGESRREKGKEMREKRREKIMATLDKLAATEGLTKEDVHKALKNACKGRSGDGKKCKNKRKGAGNKKGGKGRGNEGGEE